MEVKKIKIIGDWTEELKLYQPNFERYYLEKSLKAMGDEEKYKKLNHHNIIHAEKKILRNSRGFLDPKTMPTLESLRDLIGLKDSQLIILKYNRGETNLLHKDYIPKYDHVEREGLEREEQVHEWKNTHYIRMLMLLEDRKPGQYMQMGDMMLNNWDAGDLYFYNGQEIYHSAGSCGDDPRYVMRITGIPTPKYNDFMSKEVHHI